MSEPGVHRQPTPEDRSAAARSVALEVLRRRRAGEDVSDAAVLSQHPQLLPELDAELQKARHVENALRVKPPAIPGFILEEQIGFGGQATVYRGTCEKLPGRTVAIKVSREARFNPRLERGVRILGAIQDCGIPCVVAAGRTADGLAYYAMDFIEGRDLDEYLLEFVPGEAAECDWARAIGVFVRLCQIVETCHRAGVVHGDLKPANVRVDPSNNPFLLDFGLARWAGDEIPNAPTPREVDERFVGSLRWSSPEQLQGDASRMGPASDIYSLGVMAYEVISGGRFPHEPGRTPGEMLERISASEPPPPCGYRSSSQLKGINAAELDRAILKAVGIEPTERWRSAGELGQALSAAVVETPVEERAGKAAARPRLSLSWRLTAATLGLAGTALVALWFLRPPSGLGSVFQINTSTRGAQVASSVAANEAGDFVVAWHSDGGQDGSGSGIFAQRYDAAGRRVGGEFCVNNNTEGDQEVPSIAMDQSGAFVVVWHGPNGGGSIMPNGIFGRRFSRDGIPSVGEFKVHQKTRWLQRYARIAMTLSGEFVVAWEARDSAAGAWHVLGRWYDAAGRPMSGEEEIEQSPPGDEPRPGLGINGHGDAVIAWYGQDSGRWTIQARRFRSRGIPAGNEFRADALHNSGNRPTGARPGVGIDGSGRFVIAWEDLDQWGFGIFGRRFAKNGSPLGDAGEVNERRPGRHLYMHLAVNPAGYYVVTWHGTRPGDRYDCIYARRFSPDGAPIGDEFRVNEYLLDWQASPAVAIDGHGNAIFSWQGLFQDGDGWGIFGRRFIKAFPGGREKTGG